MEFFMKLPRSKREFALFIAVISIISVNIIAPIITCLEIGFSFKVYKEVLTVLPFIWIAVITLVLLTFKPAEWLTGQVVTKGDSFKATVTINILCSVFILSIFLTIIGTWIGSRKISLDPIYWFFYKWPKNFAISLGVELFIAQPAARFVMLKYHLLTSAQTD
ncbi:hypothetical protein EDD76_11425 [Kineothrix alysoides]|uniref:DUF2798 domain-containing protein n=1 Tax=Kineothrix alysoides TaxID=1469948 RepID=A0A4R1QT11_9FIRM|nr:hypothetical protein [Kineothrix alysoides]TCL55615.1 hypothetical protein EDD76_11425 [Kineothrix alysoides]